MQEKLRERVRLTVGIMDIDWQKIVASMQNVGSKSGSMGILVGISAAATQQIIDQTGQYMDLKAGATGEICVPCTLRFACRAPLRFVCRAP